MMINSKRKPLTKKYLFLDMVPWYYHVFWTYFHCIMNAFPSSDTFPNTKPSLHAVARSINVIACTHIFTVTFLWFLLALPRAEPSVDGLRGGAEFRVGISSGFGRGLFSWGGTPLLFSPSHRVQWLRAYGEARPAGRRNAVLRGRHRHEAHTKVFACVYPSFRHMGHILANPEERINLISHLY